MLQSDGICTMLQQFQNLLQLAFLLGKRQATAAKKPSGGIGLDTTIVIMIKVRTIMTFK